MSESNTNNVLSIEDLSVEFRTRDSVVHAVNRLELKIARRLALSGKPVPARRPRDWLFSASSQAHPVW